MPRFSSLRPIFDPEMMRGTVTVGTVPSGIYVPPPPPAVIGFPSTQSTGAGTNQVVMGVPAGAADDDVMVLICRKDDPWGTLPSGFIEKHDAPYGFGNDISVVTGIYDSATHGATLTFPYASGSGVTRAILYAVRNADVNTAGFASAVNVTGNDQFYPTLTTPAQPCVGFAFGFAGADFTDEQANGWTRDWDDVTTNSWTKQFSGAGAQTMPRFDNIGNAYLVTFYAVEA